LKPNKTTDKIDHLLLPYIVSDYNNRVKWTTHTAYMTSFLLVLIVAT
jgi:hypothetical protein